MGKKVSNADRLAFLYTGLDIRRAESPLDKARGAARTVIGFCSDKLREFAHQREQKVQIASIEREYVQSIGHLSLVEELPAEGLDEQITSHLQLVHSVGEIEQPANSPQFYDQDQAGA